MAVTLDQLGEDVRSFRLHIVHEGFDGFFELGENLLLLGARSLLQVRFGQLRPDGGEEQGQILGGVLANLLNEIKPNKEITTSRYYRRCR